MNLKDVDLARFVGGQVQVQTPRQGCTYQGEICAIRLETDSETLIIETSWIARCKGIPSHGIPLGPWVRHKCEPLAIDLKSREVGDLNNGQIGLYLPSKKELVMLFPQGGHALDRSQVIDK